MKTLKKQRLCLVEPKSSSLHLSYLSVVIRQNDFRYSRMIWVKASDWGPWVRGFTRYGRETIADISTPRLKGNPLPSPKLRFELK